MALFTHLSLGVADISRSTAFYDALLTPLGAVRVHTFPDAVAYAKDGQSLWIQTPIDGEPVTVGNGSHIGFRAESRAQVDAFWEAGQAAGGRGDGAPGNRPLYGAAYYGALPRYSHATSFNERLAAAGQQLHERLCGRCHVPPDAPDVADVLGYPLHGQRADYLRYALEAYLDGTRENLLTDMEEKLAQLEDGDVEALVHYYISY